MATVTTYSNPHTAEVAHDTRLLELLSAKGRATHAAHNAANRAIAAATTATARGDVAAYKDRYFDKFPIGDLPDGTLVEVYRNGEYATYVMRDGATAAVATVADAKVATVRPGVATRLATVIEKYETAVAALKAAVDAIDAHEAGYTGWARFFLVVPTGHVHKDMYCTTCYPTTRFAPVPMLSATTEAEAVALVGPALCTVCFPLAPVDAVGGKVTEALATVLIEKGEDAFRAKLAEVAAKAAEKCGAAPYDHDHSHGHLYRPYATCNVCDTRVSLTSTGKMRAHKPKGE